MDNVPFDCRNVILPDDRLTGTCSATLASTTGLRAVYPSPSSSLLSCRVARSHSVDSTVVYVTSIRLALFAAVTVLTWPHWAQDVGLLRREAVALVLPFQCFGILVHDEAAYHAHNLLRRGFLGVITGKAELVLAVPRVRTAAARRCAIRAATTLLELAVLVKYNTGVLRTVDGCSSVPEQRHKGE